MIIFTVDVIAAVPDKDSAQRVSADHPAICDHFILVVITVAPKAAIKNLLVKLLFLFFF